MNATTRQILEDVENLPPHMQQETLDFVRFLSSKLAKTESVMLKKESNGKVVADIMTEIAARGTAFRDIKDPVTWQREIRKDRSLPGRED